MAEPDEPPPDSKLTRSKQRWAQEGRFLTGKTSRPEEQRLPPGQHLTRDWPTLDLGLTPNISRERWRLDVYGAVETAAVLGFCRSSPPSRRRNSSPTSIASPPGRATTTSGRGFRPATCSTPAGRATRRVSWCCIPMTATPPTSRWRISPPKTRCSRTQLVGRAAGAGAWRPGAAGGAASLFLEEREMAAEHRIPRRGRAGLLGSARLSQPRRSLEGRALFGRLTSASVQRHLSHWER